MRWVPPLAFLALCRSSLDNAVFAKGGTIPLLTLSILVALDLGLVLLGQLESWQRRNLLSY